MRLLFLAFGLLVAGTPLAHAHAFLDSAEPAVGSTVKTSPTVVKIWFNRQLAKSGSTIAVYDTKGMEVDRKDFAVDPDEKFLMTVSVGQLPAGTYKVVWNAFCFDKHHTTGTFTFNVAGP